MKMHEAMPRKGGGEKRRRGRGKGRGTGRGRQFSLSWWNCEAANQNNEFKRSEKAHVKFMPPKKQRQKEETL